MRRWNPDTEYEDLVKETKLGMPLIEDSADGMALLRLQAERVWEKWLTKAEWELLGCIARVGEGLAKVPAGQDDCSGVMLWALGLISATTDLKLVGIEVKDDGGVWFLTDWPTSMTEDWGHFYNKETQEYGYKGWSNDVYILGTMYGPNGQELKPPPGVAGYQPDPDWELLCQRSIAYLKENTTRSELAMEMLQKLLKWISFEKTLAASRKDDPVMKEVFQAAMAEAVEIQQKPN